MTHNIWSRLDIDHTLKVYKVDSPILETPLSSLILINIRLLFYPILGLKS